LTGDTFRKNFAKSVDDFTEQLNVLEQLKVPKVLKRLGSPTRGIVESLKTFGKALVDKGPFIIKQTNNRIP